MDPSVRVDPLHLGDLSAQENRRIGIEFRREGVVGTGCPNNRESTSCNTGKGVELVVQFHINVSHWFRWYTAGLADPTACLLTSSRQLMLLPVLPGERRPGCPEANSSPRGMHTRKLALPICGGSSPPSTSG